jgi:hypothetical protein
LAGGRSTVVQTPVWDFTPVFQVGTGLLAFPVLLILFHRLLDSGRSPWPPVAGLLVTMVAVSVVLAVLESGMDFVLAMVVVLVIALGTAWTLRQDGEHPRRPRSRRRTRGERGRA